MPRAGGWWRRRLREASRGPAAAALASALLSALLTAACASGRPHPVLASSMRASVQMAGDFSGTLALDGDVLTLQLERAAVRYLGWAAGDTAAVEGVTLRAVVVSDSAGRGIPLGVSSALAVADLLRIGEVRALHGAELAVPIPPGHRMRDLWIAFQMRGTVHGRDAEPALLIAYACSERNLLGDSKSAAARARRMRASYTAGCTL